jgi:hypothetical protein
MHEGFPCIGCVLGKQTRTTFEDSTSVTTEIGGQIHKDVCGPIRGESVGKFLYFITFIDYATKYFNIELLKEKSSTTILKTFNNFVARFERQTNTKIRKLRMDNGTEYTLVLA